MESSIPVPERLSKFHGSRMRNLRVAVVGIGHVGLPTALVLARRGHDVVGVDVNREAVRALTQGKPHLFEAGLAEHLQSMDGRIKFTSDIGEHSRPCDAAVICVDTPSADGGQADLSRLEAAVASVVPNLTKGGHVVIRSTVPPGTTMLLARETVRRSPGGDLSFSHVPEFMRQGSAFGDMENPSRIVIGADTEQAKVGARLLFHRDETPIEIMPTRAAEMVKYAANAYLALRVSYANMMAELCEASRVDFDDVRRGIGHDPRIGHDYLVPGLGFGGPCLPKDLMALKCLSIEAGVDDTLLQATWNVNQRARTRIADIIARTMEPGDRVAILGLSFKGDTLGLRDSPAMSLATELMERRFFVVGFHPMPTRQTDTTQEVPVAATIMDAVAGAKAIVIGADWEEFRETDWQAIGSVAQAAVVYDCRCLLDPEVIKAAGLGYFRPGYGQGGFGSHDGGPTLPVAARSPRAQYGQTARIGVNGGAGDVGP